MVPRDVRTLLASANWELKIWLMSSMEKVSGSESALEEVQVMVLGVVLFSLISMFPIVMVALAAETTARIMVLMEHERGSKQAGGKKGELTIVWQQ